MEERISKLSKGDILEGKISENDTIWRFKVEELEKYNLALKSVILILQSLDFPRMDSFLLSPHVYVNCFDEDYKEMAWLGKQYRSLSYDRFGIFTAPHNFIMPTNPKINGLWLPTTWRAHSLEVPEYYIKEEGHPISQNILLLRKFNSENSNNNETLD